MPLSHDLQDIITDVSAWIAASETIGRADLEVLRRNLNAAARAAGRLESDAFIGNTMLSKVCEGIDAKVADLSGLARHARSLLPAQVTA